MTYVAHTSLLLAQVKSPLQGVPCFDIYLHLLRNVSKSLFSTLAEFRSTFMSPACLSVLIVMDVNETKINLPTVVSIRVNGSVVSIPASHLEDLK